MTEISKTNLSEFTTTELLQWFNDNSGEAPVKRFTDRATAERRVCALLDKKAGITTEAKAAKPAAAKVAVKRAPKEKKEKRTPEQRSAAVKGSWDDKKTRAARSARHNVRVAGVLYESTLKAFVALKLDTKAHQRVRKEIVANGKADHEGHKFILVPKEE